MVQLQTAHGTINVGFAAHITAAAPGGPRYDPSLTKDQRMHHRNGILLCGTHAKLVDSDESYYTVKKLQEWKRLAELRSFKEVAESKPSPSGPRLSDDKDVQTAFDLLLNYSKVDLSAFQQSLGWPSDPITLNLRMLDGESIKRFSVNGLASGIGVSDQVAVIAAPGTGKTTTLLQLAEVILANAASVAVFIPLSEWATGADTFFQSLLKRAAFRNTRERQFELLARNGKLVLILDGWNELDTVSRKRVRHDLKALGRDFPDLRVVISSRHRNFDIPIDGPVIKVELLTESQQLKLAKSLRGTDGESLLDHAWRTPGLVELVAIPLYLTALLKQAPGGSLPTTKEEVLRSFVEELEKDRDKLAALREVLQGFHRMFLEEIAAKATGKETVALSEVQARAIISTVQEWLRAEKQITELIQPMRVLDTLADAHMLVWSGTEAVNVSFQHQQFQEWFASFHVQKLMLSSEQGDHDSNKTFREKILDIPVWEEAILFACDRLSRADENGVKAAAHAILQTLNIDPLLSAEMIRRSSDEVWGQIRDDVVSFVRKWHTTGHVDRAVKFMIDTGRAEFSEFVWPLVSDEDDQVHLHTLRAGKKFRPGVLGPDVETRIAALPDKVKVNVISKIASYGDMDGIELATSLAKADASPKIKISTIESLVFRRAGRFFKEILESAPNEVWQSIAKKWHAHEFDDPEVSARIQVEADKLFVEETDPLRALNTILAKNVHDPRLEQKVLDLVEKIDFSDRDQDNRWVVHRAYELYPNEVVAGLLKLLEQGKQVPIQTDEMLHMSDIVIDDGPLADCVLNHAGDEGMALDVMSVVGPKTVGNLIDKIFALHACISENVKYDKSLSNKYNRLIDLVKDSKINSLTEAVLERADTEDPEEIYVLANLISRHGGSIERERLIFAPETHQRIATVVKRWAEFLLSSAAATRAQFAEIACVAERLESPELVPVLLELLSEDLIRLKQAQKEWLEARKQGRQIQNDARMRWALQYRRAFAAIGDPQTIDAMKTYLLDSEFGFEAAHVLKAVWQETQPPTNESGFMQSWPDFSLVPEAYNRRQSGTNKDTHILTDDIIAAIKDLIKSGAPESDLKLALKLATVAFSMPYVGKREMIDALLQLPVAAVHKRDFLTVFILAGEAISAKIVLQGIDDLLEEAKTKPWVLQEQDGWQLMYWLMLLPFTDKPASVLDILDQVEGFRAEPWRLRSLLSALGYAPSAEAETVLDELAKRDERFLSEHNWLVALTNRNTLSAYRILLELTCNISFTGQVGKHDYSDLGRKISELIASNDQFRQDVYQRFAALEDGPAKSTLEYAIAGAADTQGVLLLTREGAARENTFQATSLYRALRNVLVGQTQVDSSGTQQLYSLPAAELRKGLFDIVISDSPAKKRLAIECLCAIDEIRDNHGHVDSEPRHPNINTCVPWPLLDAENVDE